MLHMWKGVSWCVWVCVYPSALLLACLTVIIWQGKDSFLKLALAVIYERKKWQGLHEGRKHTWARAKNTHAHRSVMLERHANRISLTLFIIQLMILWKWAAAWISLMNSTCVCHLNEVQLMCTHTAHMHAVSLTGLQWWRKGYNVFSTSICFFNSNILKLTTWIQDQVPAVEQRTWSSPLQNFWIIHRGLNVEARCVLVAWRMVMTGSPGSTCWGNCRNKRFASQLSWAIMPS